MEGYYSECRIGTKVLTDAAGVFVDVFESIYGMSNIEIRIGMPELSILEKLVDAFENTDEDISVRWCVFFDGEDDPLWSDWRIVDVVDCAAEMKNSGNVLVLYCHDKLYSMKQQCPMATFKDMSLKDVLNEIAEKYNLDLDTDVAGNKENFYQCEDNDYTFISKVIIPSARQKLFEAGQQNSGSCDFLFYINKGNTLVVKRRTVDKSEEVKFSVNKVDGQIPVADYTYSINNSKRMYTTVGKGVDFTDGSFFYREFNSMDLDLKYDEFGKGVSEFEKGPNSFYSYGAPTMSRNVNHDLALQGVMGKPSMASRYRLAIPSVFQPMMDVGIKAVFDANQSFMDGEYMVYAHRTKCSLNEAYTITYLERASKDG